MSTLVVGVDGSAPSAAAVTWAAQFAARGNDKVLAVYAYEPDQAELPPDVVDERRGEAVAALEEWAAPLRDAGANYEARVVDNQPTGGLLGVVETDPVALIVVGRRTGGFLHHRIGSTAEHLAHHTPVPLALVPEQAPATIGRVVVGVAGWASDERAVKWTADNARSFGPVTAVHAAAPPAEIGGAEDPAEFRARTTAKLDGEWTAPLRDAGVDVTTVMSGDRPAHAVLDAAAGTGATLIVVGTSSTSTLTGVRLGGVAMHLVHHAELPLVLVPAPSEEPHEPEPG
jgi:nucleotide-binding universal stress UspA family protein